MRSVASIALSLFVVFINTSCASGPCACRKGGATAVATGGPVKALVLMTDFGVKDGAVSAMRGVALATAPHVLVSDLTHEVPAYNIWEASFRLMQTYKYWPVGTVFVTVIDPGVGSERHSIVMKSKSGHYFVGPDNGLFTLVADENGVEDVRVIDESKQRLRGSGDSYTFHGRDLYVYVGARLADGQLSFEDSGVSVGQTLTRIPYQKAVKSGEELKGLVPVLDPQYGNVWTNIPRTFVRESFAEAKTLKVTIRNGKRVAFEARLPVVDTFAGVDVGKPLLYFNSLLNLSLALNQGDFAKAHKIGSGPNWTVSVSK